MNRRTASNPKGLGFTELMLCSDSVFTQVCREIEAERWQSARQLLDLNDSSPDGCAAVASHGSLDRKS